MIKPVAIVGCGPSALVAAQALKLAGVPMVIFSRDTYPSKLGGAQFLHKPIYGVNDEKQDFDIRYTVVGSAYGYERKVYGEESVPFVSFTNVKDGELVPAWSLQNTYDRLIEEFMNYVNTEYVDAFVMKYWQEQELFSAVIYSAPRMSICQTHAGWTVRPHTFVSQPIRVKNESVLGYSFDNTIIYDGTPNVSWYRTSRIGGVGSTEWGANMEGKSMPHRDVRRIDKPLRTDCNCWERDSDAVKLTTPVMFVGRFGTWRKGVLVHDAFADTVALAEGLLR